MTDGELQLLFNRRHVVGKLSYNLSFKKTLICFQKSLGDCRTVYAALPSGDACRVPHVAAAGGRSLFPPITGHEKRRHRASRAPRGGSGYKSWSIAQSAHRTQRTPQLKTIAAYALEDIEEVTAWRKK
jgi:hypothetical protein